MTDQSQYHLSSSVNVCALVCVLLMTENQSLPKYGIIKAHADRALQSVHVMFALIKDALSEMRIHVKQIYMMFCRITLR